MVVERQLATERKSRIEMGRKASLKRAWEWKEYSHSQIVSRIKKLGLSVDWSRERFTLDEGLSRAVREAFVRLYREGLIYRGEYIVNWCPRCKTAISDLEVLSQPVAGKLYTFFYPFEDGEGGIEVTTTSPETMLGATDVAVHTDDERYGDEIGRRVRL